MKVDITHAALLTILVLLFGVEPGLADRIAIPGMLCPS